MIMSHMVYPDYTFCDMHCHMMPGVDDGAKDMEMAARMMQVAADNNIERIILTPHYKGGHHNVHPSQQLSIIRSMERTAQDLGLDRMRFYPGNEVLYDSCVMESLESGQIQTLAGTSFVLVEFRQGDSWERIRDGLREISWTGCRIVLAHSERYDCLLRSFENAKELRRSGVCLQVNAGSIASAGHGTFAAAAGRLRQTSNFVNRLLKDEMVAFIATDAHRDTGRAPCMLDCWRVLRRRLDPDYVRELTRENVLRLLRDEEIP